MQYFIIFLFTLFFFFKDPVFAVTDPHAVPNNKFGIHIIDENDLESASQLVNSSGGDWGYITMVITENDRNIEKWTNTFNKLQKLHLIPVIRLATSLKNDYWMTPTLEERTGWLEFLNLLPWPVKNRYIIIFNEPNHAKEWGNKIDASGYSDILVGYSAYFKKSSADYFILPAGLDASAPNSLKTMSEDYFLKTVSEYNPDWPNYIDGWTSHSYPNPGFSGKVSDKGRGTLTSFKWELNLLKKFGYDVKLPVFITETGWTHNSGTENTNLLNPDTVAQNFVSADELVWSSSEIVMISPFLLNYQSLPFNNFSWQKMNSKEFYPQFDAYRSLAKIKGKPELNFPSATPSPQIFFSPKTAPKSDIFITFLNFFKKIVYAAS